MSELEPTSDDSSEFESADSSYPLEPVLPTVHGRVAGLPRLCHFQAELLPVSPDAKPGDEPVIRLYVAPHVGD